MPHTTARYTPLSKLPNFDPRHAPVASVDTHLPGVPLHALQADALRRRFQSPPVWQPEVREEPPYAQRQPMQASVLVPIVLRPEPTVLLTQRTTHLSTHSGQIAFPGGKADEEDADAAATALREAFEEVGLASGYVEILGQLPLYTTGTSFLITPVVALVRPGFTLTPNSDEVSDAFEVPLHFLMNPANHRRHVVEAEGVRREWFSMPYREASSAISNPATEVAQERFIWGATAGMLRNLYRFLSA